MSVIIQFFSHTSGYFFILQLQSQTGRQGVSGNCFNKFLHCTLKLPFPNTTFGNRNKDRIHLPASLSSCFQGNILKLLFFSIGEINLFSLNKNKHNFLGMWLFKRSTCHVVFKCNKNKSSPHLSFCAELNTFIVMFCAEWVWFPLKNGVAKKWVRSCISIILELQSDFRQWVTFVSA